MPLILKQINKTIHRRDVKYLSIFIYFRLSKIRYTYFWIIMLVKIKAGVQRPRETQSH